LLLVRQTEEKPSNPFDEPVTIVKKSEDVNPFLAEESSDINLFESVVSNPFDESAPKKKEEKSEKSAAADSNPFEETVSIKPNSNPFDVGSSQSQSKEKETNPFDTADPANPFDSADSSNPFDSEEPANPFGTPDMENPFDEEDTDVSFARQGSSRFSGHSRQRGKKKSAPAPPKPNRVETKERSPSGTGSPKRRKEKAPPAPINQSTANHPAANQTASNQITTNSSTASKSGPNHPAEDHVSADQAAEKPITKKSAAPHVLETPAVKDRHRSSSSLIQSNHKNSPRTRASTDTGRIEQVRKTPTVNI